MDGHPDNPRDGARPRAGPGRLPPWIRVRLRADGAVGRVQAALRGEALHTVCESAQCPNRLECFHRGTATVMILGDVCTRRCRFCAVRQGRPAPPDPEEPARVAVAARRLGWRYVVVTSVTRDDLPDRGAGQFAATIAALRGLPGVRVEVLTPDFLGEAERVREVLAAAPAVFNHNLETVARLQAPVRPQADYARSLGVLRTAAAWRPAVPVKSGLMVGLGETAAELEDAMRDLRAAGCRLLTLGQYLAPSRRHWPVARFATPAEFEEYRRRALALGFAAVAAGPLVRSSYQAESLAGGGTAVAAAPNR